MKKGTFIFLALGAAGLAAWYFLTRKKGTEAPPPIGEEGRRLRGDKEGTATVIDYTTDQPGMDEAVNRVARLMNTAKSTAGAVLRKVTKPEPPPARIDPTPKPTPTPTPTPKPAPSPQNPRGSTKLFPGFEGYFVVEAGDTLSKIAQRIGIGGTNWSLIRDHRLNDWLVNQMPDEISGIPKAKWGGVDMRQNYGKTVGVDCDYPGWNATHYKYKYTGQFPVLYWDNEDWSHV